MRIRAEGRRLETHRPRPFVQKAVDRLRDLESRRRVILLLGGEKSRKWDRWYKRAIPTADRLYDNYQDGLADAYVCCS